MKIHQVAQRSTDLDRSIEFYRDTLGARFIAKFDPAGIAFLDFNGVRVMLGQSDGSTTIYFRVDDIDAVCESLKAKGIEITSEPHMIYRDDAGQFGPAGNEEWMAFFNDPDDNLIGVVEQRLEKE